MAADASIQRTIETYGAAWLEGDPEARQRLLEAAWADDATYTDPSAHVVGREALVAHIGNVQQTRPGCRIELTSEADAHHNAVRFTWRLAGPGGATLREGIDFGEIGPDGRLTRIIGFFGPVASIAN